MYIISLHEYMEIDVFDDVLVTSERLVAVYIYALFIALFHINV